MRYFCTYFDHGYLQRGLALYASLRRHAVAFRLWVLCMDEISYQTLVRLALPGVELIALHDFERGDEELLRAKDTRSKVEYYFTCTPSLPLYIMAHWPEVDLITYLDADLYFFADPQPLFDALGTGSITIIAHRFAPQLRHLAENGVYNVGWLSFRRDANGLACLRWWRERCNEWCYDRIEPERFADQKYLDDWPQRFTGVVVLTHKGANLAPWNVANYQLTTRGGQIWVDEDPLIFFHFHAFRQPQQWVYDHRLDVYKVQPSMLLLRQIYVPYIQMLAALRLANQPELHRHVPGRIERRLSDWLDPHQHVVPGRYLQWLGKTLDLAWGLLIGRYILVSREGRLYYLGSMLWPEDLGALNSELKNA